MATKNKGLLMRNDIFSYLSKSRCAGITADILNNKALPLFEEFGVEISKENAIRYCSEGGLDRLAEDLLGTYSEKEAKIFRVSKTYILSAFNKYPNFPQFSKDEAANYSEWLNLLTVGKVKYTETVRNKNGVPEEVEKEKICFLCDNEAVTEASNVYVSPEYEKDYKELESLCEKISIFFGKKGKAFSDLYHQGLLLNVEEGMIVPDKTRIDDSFFKKLRENRK